MEQFAITAQRRDSRGTGAARQYRREGFIPGVAYGHGQETVNLLVDSKALIPVLHHRGSTIIGLSIEGVDVDADLAALLKEIQRDPVSRKVLSVDFQWISLKEAVTVSVPVALAGEAPGVTAEAGVLEQVLFELSVSCMPTAIPENIEVDISGLNLGDTLHVSDLQIPEDIKVLNSPEDAVVTIARGVTAADLEVRAEGEEGEELGELAEEEIEGEEEGAEGEEKAEATEKE